MKKYIARFKNKVSSMVSRQQTGIADDFAKFYVGVALRRQLLQKAIKNRSKIEVAYIYYTDMYEKILNYLYNDFGIDKIENVTEDIEQELKFKEEFDKVIQKKLIKMATMMDKFNLTLVSKKWYLLNIIFEFYLTALDKLQRVSDVKKYKDIDFAEELERFENDKYLVEDFSHFTKEKPE